MKSFFKKEPWVKPFSPKVAKRVSSIPTADLEMWAEQAVYELGRCLTAYNKSRDKRVLEEALTGVEAAHAVIDQLYLRSTTTL
jgi:hypothetical protein